jgi:hypothetical protein
MNTEFFNLLHKAISCDDCDDTDKNNIDDCNDIINYNNECLITYLPLKKDYVRLYCGHCFNYEPIFNEVYNQKYNRPSTETQLLRKQQIKCPYCRKIQNNILPPNKEFVSVNYVNYPIRYCMKTNFCSYVFKSGKKKNIRCNKNCYNEYCGTHLKTIEKQKNKIVKDCSNCCSFILTSGKNKGKQCSRNNKYDGYCKTHYQKINKIFI